MNIPPYWKKGRFNGVNDLGKPCAFDAWGWSTNSESEAEARGAERARKAFLSVAAGSEKRNEYDYLDLPIREEIIATEAPLDKAIVTRNRYGALVLNSSKMLFVDIDLPEPTPCQGIEVIKHLVSPSFRKRKRMEAHDIVINRVADWSRTYPQSPFRLYQTKAGYRLIFTQKAFSPTSDEVARVFEELGADPLYRHLTVKQESFRARLTPKPWRIGLRRPASRHPRSASEQQPFDDWLATYEKKSRLYAVCAFIDSFGEDAAPDPSFETALALHDQQAKAYLDLPLA